MISAASTASGRLSNSGVRNSTVTQDQAGGEQRRDLGAGACALVDGGLREAAAGGQAADEARAGVRGAERDQLLVGVDLVAVLGREGLRGAERLAEDDEHHARGGRQQHRDVRRRDVRDPDRGEPAGHRADDRDAVLHEVERAADRDPEHEREQSARQPRGEPLGPDEERERRHADHQRHGARLVEVREQVDQLLQAVALALRDPEELGQLLHGHEDREAEHEPLHHRAREELRDEPQPERAGEEEQGRAEQHHGGGGGRVLLDARGLDARDRGREQHRGGRRRRDDEVPARAEHDVGGQGREQRVEPRLGRQTRQPRVGDRLRHQETPERHPGDQVEANRARGRSAGATSGSGGRAAARTAAVPPTRAGRP